MNEEKVIIEYQDKLQEKEVKKFKEATSNYYVLGYIDKLEQENKQLKGSLQTYEILYLKEQLQQKEDIIYKIKKCIEEKEEYYGDYMGDGNYTMYSMMGANNNRIPYIKSNLIKQILDNKGE